MSDQTKAHDGRLPRSTGGGPGGSAAAHRQPAAAEQNSACASHLPNFICSKTQHTKNQTKNMHLHLHIHTSVSAMLQSLTHENGVVRVELSIETTNRESSHQAKQNYSQAAKPLQQSDKRAPALRQRYKACGCCCRNISFHPGARRAAGRCAHCDQIVALGPALVGLAGCPAGLSVPHLSSASL